MPEHVEDKRRRFPIGSWVIYDPELIPRQEDYQTWKNFTSYVGLVARITGHPSFFDMMIGIWYQYHNPDPRRWWNDNGTGMQGLVHPPYCKLITDPEEIAMLELAHLGDLPR